jgi:CubicO group peptidase (beta-lactamase class C family)
MKVMLPVLLISWITTHETYDSSLPVSPISDTTKPSISGDLERSRSFFPLIGKIYSDHAKKNNIPGISFAIVMEGRLVYSGSYGHTDLAKKIPVTTSSVFRIASMSKSFTAMAILKLRDEGKLKLDDPASNYIPELKNTVYPSKDSEPITIRHLLTHGAGFPEDNPWGDRQLSDSDKELSDFISRQISFSTSPGTAYEYSNLGFAMLGRIVTKVSGKPYQQYIRENIWMPLRMKSAAWEYTDVPAERLAHGYRWQEGQWIEEPLLHDKADGSWGAMGSMLSSVEEYAPYMALHLSAWPPSDDIESGPVKRSSIREMQHPWRFSGLNAQYTYPGGRPCAMASAYCYGLRWSRDCEGRTYIAHSGGLPGFGSHWQVMPEFGIGVVAMGNRTYAPMSVVNLQVLDTLIRLAGLKPRPIPVSGILQQRRNELMKYVQEWNGTEQSGIFAENFFPDNPLPILRKRSLEIFGSAGRILSIGEMKAENNLRGTFIIQCEQKDLEIYFTLSPENPPLIQEYRIRELSRK